MVQGESQTCNKSPYPKIGIAGHRRQNVTALLCRLCDSWSRSAVGRKAGGSCRKSVAIMIRLERPVLRYADIRRLLVAELRQLHAQFVDVQPGDLLVEMLRQHVDVVLILVAAGPQLDLRQHLVGEAR